jgi:LETM1 and EF-hand domain-containing protein 1, mitochondrial
MSASSRAAARRAAAAHPFAAARPAFRPGVGLSSSAHLGRHSRNLPQQVPVIALFTPHRYVSTEHSSAGQSDGPPPGFDLEKAKQPLKKEDAKSDATKSAAADSKSQAEAKTPNSEPTAEPKTLTELAEKKEAELQTAEKQEKKMTLGQRIKHEIQHYWDGTKLLATEVKISSKLATKMAAGYELTRREHRQLRRTTQDLARLVPFSVFIIVPFAEALLPIALKLFPNLLPSTYEAQQSKDKKAATLRATRKEVSQFLRQTLKETGLPLSQATAQKEEFAAFFRKLRSTGEKPTAEDVIKVCKTFRDDLTLDNLSRPQLVNICRYMNLNTFGTDMMLRYQIRHRMRQIKRDDKVIAYEGVDSLTVSELQTACAARGIKTYGVSPATLREELQAWLDLRLKHGVPSTLLVMSNAFMYGRKAEDGSFHSQIEALTNVLSSIPEELYHEIELEVHNAEGAATNKQRLEVLKEQQELIEEENKQDEENQSTGMATPRDVEDIDEKDERMLADQASTEAQINEAKSAEAEGVVVQQKVEPKKDGSN